MTATDRHGNVPYVQFRTRDGRTVAWSRAEYEQALHTAMQCRCAQCDCCRAVEYHVETKGRASPD